MAISAKDMQLEEKKLVDVKEIIDEELESAGGDLFQEEKELKEFQKLMWESKQEMDEQELALFLYNNESQVGKLDEKLKHLRKLVRVKDKPYFGSIVFNDDPYYIGITSVKKGLDYHVVDWRAPVSSMFYNYDELGEAMYTAPGGTEHGVITQKRQYQIEEGKLKEVFDTGMNIQDDMLQTVLAQSKSDKMRNIVNTIQKEQNEVIRNERSKNIVVQGIAGSGKTSVALHRIAFLLYRFEVLTNSNVLIFSPNQVFSEYISNVLPDLGEENTLQTTFHEFASSFIQEYYRVESYSSFVERYYKGLKQDNDLIRFKLSDKMGDAIEEFVKYYCKASKFTADIEFKEKIIPKNEINELLHERYANKPLFERVELIAEKINNSYFKGTKGDFKSILSRLKKAANFTTDYKKIYKAFFDSAIFNKYYNKEFSRLENNNNLSEHVINYEDSTPFIYLKCLLEGYPYKVAMRHVVIDEAQDYTYLQYKIIRKIFKMANFTILGDVNQTVNPFYKYDNLDVLLELFEDGEYIELNKTYRSSPEIIEYANSVLGLKHVSAIRRDQNVPVIKRDIKDLKHIGRDINYLHKKYKSVAIITKSIDEAKAIVEAFKKNYNIISLIDINTESFNTELVVAPAYGVKGLEFDACVIVNNFSSDPYLYYVAVTRAQHELVVYE